MSDLAEFMKECNRTLLTETDREVSTVKEYLVDERKLLEKSWKSHTIGYCRIGCKLPDPVRFYGTSEKPEEKWDISRYVQGKIIVPVFSEFGEIIAFASRSPTSAPGNSWWNLPSPFKKGNHLYLLDKARKSIYEKNKVYIVEGYMDALVLFQYGLKNVVALMGTAFTLRKISLIARYCNNVCLCFDTDANESGDKGKKIAITMLKKYDFCEDISTIKLPLKVDPDIFVSKEGLNAFLALEKVLTQSEINKLCKEVVKEKTAKEILYAQ